MAKPKETQLGLVGEKHTTLGQRCRLITGSDTMEAWRMEETLNGAQMRLQQGTTWLDRG